MAAAGFTQLCNEVLDIYPKVINAKDEVVAIKNEVLNAKNEVNTFKSSVNALTNEAKNEVNTLADSVKLEINNISSDINTKASLITQNANGTNEALAAANKAKNEAKNASDMAQTLYESTRTLREQSANDVLASNQAKVRAMEYASKAAANLTSIINIADDFKTEAQGEMMQINLKAANTIKDINDKGSQINEKLNQKADYEMGRMEFKRRQVDEKIKQANAVILNLEAGTLSDEMARLVRKNKWDRAVLACGIMENAITKGELLFINEECEQVKKQTEKIALEIEMDRLEIIRNKEVAREAANKAQEFAKGV